MRSRQAPGAGENFRKHTAAAGDVQHNEYRRPQAARQLGYQHLQ